jgi:hypothetical protein
MKAEGIRRTMTNTATKPALSAPVPSVVEGVEWARLESGVCQVRQAEQMQPAPAKRSEEGCNPCSPREMSLRYLTG